MAFGTWDEREATMEWKRIGVSLMALPLLFWASVSAFAAVGDKAEFKGMINDRAGGTLLIKTASGNRTVILTDETRTKDNTGLFGWGREELSSSVLIPGLKVDIDGVVADEEGRITAKTITVDGDDLETSELIQAGLHPTAEQVAANMKAIEANAERSHLNAQDIAAIKKYIAMYEQNAAAHKTQTDQNIKDIQEATNRFMALREYDVKHQATVKFPVGSSTISPQDQEQLKQLAQNALQTTGYIVEVTGHADANGDDKMNEKLSEDRAKAVVGYLIQQGGVPVHRVVAPGAMGEYGPVASNETPAGRAENRRVEVKVLVNRGMASN
jgi:outer membrane protein OmpA-like peptidoglycan-associated protein